MTTATSPTIIPTPQFSNLTGDAFPLGQIVLDADGADPWALQVLAEGLAGLGLPTSTDSPTDGTGTTIKLTSEIEAPTARCADVFGTDCTVERLSDEGYIVTVDKSDQGCVVTVAAQGGAGMSYGVDTILQLIDATNEPSVSEATIFDYPAVKMRIYGGTKSLDEAARMRFNTQRGGATEDEIAAMRKRHIEPWVSVHPSHASAGQPSLRYSDAEAVEEAIQPLMDAAALGVNIHSLNFDDIDLKLNWPEDIATYGTIGKAHVDFYNTTLARLREVNPDALLIVIPIVYSNGWLAGSWVYTADEDEVYDYLTTIGEHADPSIEFVWTGETVESMNMTDDDIRQWVDLVKRKPIVFENVPTGDPDDLGAVRNRTPNVGELLEGWIYIHRGPHAEIAESSTVEYIWNPKAYDSDAARLRAIRNIAGDAHESLERLVDVFRDMGDPRFRNPLWREGRLLEVVDPLDEQVADFYVNRLQVISETLPVLNEVIGESEFYQAIRERALKSVDPARAFLETYVMLRSAQQGETAEAIEAGDRAEAIYNEWTRYSTGTTDLNADTDCRAALTYIEQVGVANTLRALRRGGAGPIPWTRPGGGDVRCGRPCSVLRSTGDSTRVGIYSQSTEAWLVITACGASAPLVRLDIDGETVDLPNGVWSPDRWTTHAIKVSLPGGEHEVNFTATDATNWAIARVALLDAVSPERLLHTMRSTASYGESTVIWDPKRYLTDVTTSAVTGKVAIRRDIALIKGASGRFYDLDSETRIGQTFHLPASSEINTPPKDAIGLVVRESSDGDYLCGVGVQFQQHGDTPLALTLWRWAGSLDSTLSTEGYRIASTTGTMDTPHGTSHHVCFFPLDVELDEGATYYFEVTAPEGWSGWRLRRSYGWYGRRSDQTRSGYINGEIESGVDVPFRTYVADVYSARWRK
jgi:hypothetical protein